jgi:uncharacterized UPF0146 family protein
MRSETRAALLDAFDGFDSAVEVGVGHQTTVAEGLAARGVDVTVTDIVPRKTPASVTFVQDDLTKPSRDVYRGADLVYALNCPPELQAPLVAIARRVGAACRFTTLGGDPAVVPAAPRQLPGETLYTADIARD